MGKWTTTRIVCLLFNEHQAVGNVAALFVRMLLAVAYHNSLIKFLVLERVGRLWQTPDQSTSAPPETTKVYREHPEKRLVLTNAKKI
jgi:hypothetical protein